MTVGTKIIQVCVKNGQQGNTLLLLFDGVAQPKLC